MLMTKEAPSGVASITVNDEGESNRVVTLFKMWYICQVCCVHVRRRLVTSHSRHRVRSGSWKKGNSTGMGNGNKNLCKKLHGQKPLGTHGCLVHECFLYIWPTTNYRGNSLHCRMSKSKS